MSCRAAIIAITPARSPFTMEARSVLARSTLPLMRPRIEFFEGLTFSRMRY